MEGPISFSGYKEQESNLILPEHDGDDDDDDILPYVTGNRYLLYLLRIFIWCRQMAQGNDEKNKRY